MHTNTNYKNLKLNNVIFVTLKCYQYFYVRVLVNTWWYRKNGPLNTFDIINATRKTQKK